MRALELKIPPPLIALILAAAMWELARIGPAIPFVDSLRIPCALAFLLLGLGIDIAALFAFRQEKTTINPMKPETALALVTHGIFAYTRNPMYLGLTFLLIAWGFRLASLLAFLGPIAFILYINRFQILPEERALASLFGDAYTRYAKTVRRWI